MDAFLRCRLTWPLLPIIRDDPARLLGHREGISGSAFCRSHVFGGVSSLTPLVGGPGPVLQLSSRADVVEANRVPRASL